MTATTQRTIRSAGPALTGLTDLADTIDALIAVERDASACAVAMVAGELHCAMGTAARAALDCADIASAAWHVLSRIPSADATVTRSILESAAAAADRCVHECGTSTHAHCQIHAASARRASEACRSLLRQLPS